MTDNVSDELSPQSQVHNSYYDRNSSSPHNLSYFGRNSKEHPGSKPQHESIRLAPPKASFKTLCEIKCFSDRTPTSRKVIMESAISLPFVVSNKLVKGREKTLNLFAPSLTNLKNDQLYNEDRKERPSQVAKNADLKQVEFMMKLRKPAVDFQLKKKSRPTMLSSDLWDRSTVMEFQEKTQVNQVLHSIEEAKNQTYENRLKNFGDHFKKTHKKDYKAFHEACKHLNTRQQQKIFGLPEINRKRRDTSSDYSNSSNLNEIESPTLTNRRTKTEAESPKPTLCADPEMENKVSIIVLY